MQYTKPWELNSKLTKEHILTIASFIKYVRSEVIELHDEVLGDTALSLGMRCYEVCKERIKRQSVELDWLSVITSNGRFTFGINSIPVRFVRNDPKELPNKKLVMSFETLKQIDWIKEHNQCDTQYAEIRWFFVFDTYYKKPADNVYFVGYTETGEIICQYEIILEDKVTLLTSINPKKSQPVEQKKPEPTLKSQFKVNEKDNEK